MRPVRGTPAAEVRRSQRERLFAAMVAWVSEKGYAETSVADLVSMSGVSSRSFYDIFGDKASCLTETVEAMLETWPRPPVSNTGRGDFESKVRSDYAMLAELVASQPAAAKLCLIDAFAAGEGALAPLDRAIGSYEELTVERCKESPKRAAIPEQMIAARLGGVLELARSRLLAGTEQELPALGEEIAALLAAERPPPEPLRSGSRAAKSRGEEIEVPDHAERAIRAFAVLVSERGYAASNVDDTVTRAGMTGRTFYANFRDKEDVMAAAIESTCAQVLAAVRPAFSRHSGWAEGLGAGIAAMLNFLASRPALAELLCVEVYAAGGAAVQRRARGLAPLGALIESGPRGSDTAPVVHELLVGSLLTLLHREVKRFGASALPGLAPICIYMTLAPLVGAERACEVANGGGRRPSEGAGVERPPFRRTVVKALQLLFERAARPSEVAAAVGAPVEVVRDYLAELARHSVIEVEDSGEEGGEPIYRSRRELHTLTYVSAEQTELMPIAEREELSAETRELIEVDLERSVAAGLFDRRPERALTRTPFLLDEEGWQELGDLHMQTMFAGLEIQARSKRRLERSGERGFEARSVQIAFEMPGEGCPPAAEPQGGKSAPGDET